MAAYKVTRTNQEVCTLGGVRVRRNYVAIAQRTLVAVDVGGFPILEATGNLNPSGVQSFDLPAPTPSYILLHSEIYGVTLTSSEEIRFDDRQDSARSVTCIASRGDLDVLGVKYRFVDYSKVVRFLEENPYLVSLLLEALTPLQTYLPGASLFLEVVIDPDALKGDEFIVTARRDWKVEEALEALDKFNDAWWLDNIQRADGKLTITVEHG